MLIRLSIIIYAALALWFIGLAYFSAARKDVTETSIRLTIAGTCVGVVISRFYKEKE